MPFASIIIPTYNRSELLLKRALPSVFSQTDPDWEIIIVDDGSTDSTRERIQSLKNPKIRYFLQANQGAASARNVGIENATGQIIIFLDSDDALTPDYITKAKESFKNQEVVAMAPGFMLVDEYGRVSYVYSQTKPKWMHGLGGGTAVRRQLLEEKGIRFCSQLKTFEDSDFGYRITESGTIDFRSETLYTYHFIMYPKKGHHNISANTNYYGESFELFRQRNYAYFEAWGKQALSYFWYWAGWVYLSFDRKKARSAFKKSFHYYKNYRNLTYLLLTTLIPTGLFVRINNALILVRRWHKTLSQSV